MGIVGRKDLAKAATYYRQAISAGHAGALERLKQLAESGNPDAQYEIGIVHEYGYGVEKDFAAARTWYQKAADQNHAASIFALALYTQNGVGGPKDLAKAIELCRMAARHGHAAAMNALGECYFKGTVVEQDKTKAAALVKMAADQDLPGGLSNYGWILQTGAVGEPNPDEAAEFYFRAAARGFQQGQANLRALADAGNEVARARLKQLEAGDVRDAIAPTPPDDETTLAVYTPEMLATMQELLKQVTEGNFNDAIDGLYEYVEQQPQDDIAWNLLGYAYQAKEMPREAKAAMDRAIKLKPANPDYYIGKAGLLEKEGCYHESAETLEAAIEHTPPALPLLKRLLAIESKAKRLRHVVQYGEVVWALEESKPAAFQLATAHYFLGHQSECDRYAEAYARLGGDAEKLEAVFAASEKLRGDRDTIMQRLGDVAKKNGSVDTMLDQVRKYLDYDPCYFEGWAVLGFIYMNHPELASTAEARAMLEKYRDYGKAIEMLYTAYYFAPAMHAGRRDLAKAMEENGEFERAWAEYQRIIETHPDAAITYSDAALLALKMGEYDEAIRLAERAYEIDDSISEVVYDLILVYHFTDNIEKRDELRATVEARVGAQFEKFDELFALNKYWDFGYYGNSAVTDDLVHRICEHTSFVAVKDLGTERYREILGKDYVARLHALDTPEEEFIWRRRQLVRACRSYLEQYPKSFYVQLMYGFLCSTLDRFEEADEHFDRSLEINPDFAQTYFAMGFSNFQRRDDEAAVASFSKAYERDQAFFVSAAETLWRCYWLENDKSYELGNRLARLLWEVDQKTPWIPGRLAEGYHHLGDVEQRDQFLKHARELGYEEMDRLEAMITESEAASSESDEETAESDLSGAEAEETATDTRSKVTDVAEETASESPQANDAQPTTPNKPEVSYRGDYLPVCAANEASKETCKQADRLVKERKFDEAIRLYNEAIQLDRAHVCAYTGIGWAEGMRGRQQTGMDQMNRTVDMFPRSALARIERGRYALMLNRVDLCEMDADKAIELSQCARAYELRAYCFLERGEDQSALNDLGKAIQIYPDSAHAFELRARAHRGLGNHAQAKEDESKAAELLAAKASN